MFRRSISSKVTPANDFQSSLQPAKSAVYSTSAFTSSESVSSNWQHGGRASASSARSGSATDRNLQFPYPKPADNPQHYDAPASGGRTLQASQSMSQVDDSLMPNPFDAGFGPIALPDYGKNWQDLTGHTQTDVDAMSMPYMDSSFQPHQGWSSQQQDHEQQQAQQQAMNQDHLDAPTSLSQEDFPGVNEIAALMNTYPLNLTQPFYYPNGEEQQ